MPSDAPWFKTVRRWGQITLRENEIPDVDVGMWADFWSRCRLDGVTINAAGFVATYPTRIPLHRRASHLGTRDLFGELARAARERGMRVVARIDPSRAVPEIYYARPDWFVLGADGQPRRSEDRYGSYFTCVNGAYYWEFVLQIFGEIMERYDVDGFMGESWQGYGLLPGEDPCHCAACREKYHLQRSAALPHGRNRLDPGYRQWAQWRSDCVSDVWAHWDDTLKLYKRGITWMGHPTLDSIAARADLLTAAGSETGAPLWQSGERGRLLRSLSNREQRTLQVLDVSTHGRLHSRPEAEVRLLLAEAVASGAAPCFRFSTAVPEDRRVMPEIERFYAWHSEHDPELSDASRESAATVAVLVSERTERFSPGDEPGEPAAGAVAALVRAGIPFDVVHDSRLTAAALRRYRAIVLPNIACLGQEACELLWEFGSDGGGIVATFETSLYDEWGTPRGDFGLTDRLGVKLMRPAPVGPLGAQSCFRIRESHEALPADLADTKLLAGGGRFLAVELLMDHKVPLTVVPPAPAGPEEVSWTAASSVAAPAMLLGPSGKGRIVYFPTEPDRLYHRHRQPDHARLLEAAVRWAHRAPLPVEVQGASWIDLHAYRRGVDLVVHLVNLNGSGIADGRCDAEAPVPAGARLMVRAGGPYDRAELLVGGGTASTTRGDGETIVELPEIRTHEVVVLRGG